MQQNNYCSTARLTSHVFYTRPFLRTFNSENKPKKDTCFMHDDRRFTCISATFSIRTSAFSSLHLIHKCPILQRISGHKKRLMTGPKEIRETLDFLQGEGGTLRVSEKPNSLFPMGTVIIADSADSLQRLTVSVVACIAL